MTKRDYIAMAKAIATLPATDTTSFDMVKMLADTFASIAAKDNPSFNRTKFLAACNVD
jgi:hypothetical protein